MLCDNGRMEQVAPHAARHRDLPTITIVTPSLNQGPFLAEAIESVATQNYAAAEHIIVDGGSTDETAAVLERYPHLTILHVPAQGQSHAVNVGLRAATSDVIGWLNADDRYRPGAFASGARALRDHPEADLVFSNWEEIDEDGRVIGRFRAGPYDRDAQLNGIDGVPQPTVFFRRSLLDRIGFLDERLHYVMDYDFWLRASRVTTLLWVDETWAQFRVHAASKTSSQWHSFWPEARAVARRHGGPYFSAAWRERVTSTATAKQALRSLLTKLR